jgi:L-ascorbate metabolism protein UlaG (beta-lactamase superfamily)
MTFVGHSTVLLDLNGVRLLTDPMLRERVLHIRRQVAPPPPAALERLDAVLISHLHLDHLDLPSLRRLDRHAALLVPRGAARLVHRAGFDEVVELSPGETAIVGGVEVRAVPAQHPSRRLPLGARAQPLGFDVRGARRVYFPGDTGVFADLDGRPDLALVPVWGWGIRLAPGSGHMDPGQAARATARLRPRRAVPIHWGTLFPVGRRRRHGHLLVDPPREFAASLSQLAPEVEVSVLEPGASLAL